MMDSITVICCYNNDKTYQESLVRSINKQNGNIKLIGVDNTKNNFSSASKALNYGATLAESDLLVFVHQDVIIEDVNFFQQLLEYANNYPESLLGIAGVGEDGVIYTNLVQGHEKKAGGIAINTILAAQSLDEVLVCIPKELFNRVLFDEKTCDHWHLYGVDLALSLKKMGYKSYVVPLTLHHLSTGKLSKDYAFSLYKVIRKHRKHIVKLETTCSSTKTDWLRSTRYILGLIWDHEIKR